MASHSNEKSRSPAGSDATQVLAQRIAELGLPEPWEIPIELHRRANRVIERLYGRPAPIGTISDSSLPPELGSRQLRIYRPLESGLGTAVYFHGGGWVAGDIGSHDGLCRDLTAASDCVCVSVEYRLAPENPFAAALNDAIMSFEWIRGHMNELGLPRPLVIAGDSAGGNLAAATAQRVRDGTEPVAQLLMYPILDSRFDTESYELHAAGPILSRRAMRWFFDQYDPEGRNRDDPGLVPLRAPDLAS